jgi:aminoglycoside phosphotransferase family enzyme
MRLDMTPSRPLIDSDTVLSFLRSPAAHAAHAGAVSGVEPIETHMSWLFLAGESVLKMKKPVRYPFLDFSTLAAREASCREELRLNARLAPGVYRGLMALQWRAGGLRLAPEAAADPAAVTIDWLVWMRRLPRERMLDRQIAQAGVPMADIDALAGVLAAFYRQAAPADIDGGDYLARLASEQATNRALLLQPGLLPEGVEAALDGLDAALQRHAGLLRARAEQRHLVDGHGDLRPEHVCLLRPPLVIDCLEFNAALRQVDPFDELAFLALECELAGAAWIGPRLIDGCSAALGGRPAAPLLPLYTAYRALLRARLALAHLLEPQPRTPERWQPLARRYVARARQALDACGGTVSPTTSRGTP